MSELIDGLRPKEILPIDEYDLVVVSYSGGKDSLAALLYLFDLGLPKDRIELWHQCVDGDPAAPGLMDWPCTHGYVKATSAELGVSLRLQWKDGGFEQEMLRNNARTAGITMEDGRGSTVNLPASSRGKESTRRLFPQTTADLSVRWCSSYLKIDVARRAIRNDPRFERGNLLIITGERREESTARSRYKVADSYGCGNKYRRVDQWRLVLDWSEERVWKTIQRWRIRPHPAYILGWNRVSCLSCIFGDPDQWASVREIDPVRFDRIAAYEVEFGKTIKKGQSVIEQANRGRSFVTGVDPVEIARALDTTYPRDLFLLKPDEEWHLPAGAYKRGGGPT